jgi:multiple sugar transport system permease protein
MSVVKRVVTMSVIGTLLALVLTPIVVVFTNSFMSFEEVDYHYTNKETRLFARSPYASDFFIDIDVLPNTVSLEQYRALASNPFYFHYLFNSLRLLIPIVLCNLLFSLLAAYGFTQISKKIRTPLILAFSVTMLLPLQAIIVPHYMVTSFLHLSPFLSIILPAVFNPLGTIILFQFCRAIPAELTEAAKIDGAGHIRILFHMILPLMKNGIITLAVLLSVEYWNIIDQAVIFIDSVYDQPLSVYLVEIAKDNMHIIFAASVIFLLPMLLIYNSFKENFSQGIQMSAGMGRRR